MKKQDWSRVWHNPQLDVALLKAFYVRHAYPRHSHDYYVVCVIERGVQSFTHGGTKHITLPGGIILINPGIVHTGEPADGNGFAMRCLYPTISNVERAVFELTGHHQGIPYFRDVRVDNPLLQQSILSCHQALVTNAGALESESRFIQTLVQLIRNYGELSPREQRLGKEQQAVRRARHYIDEHFADGISLTQLADHVALSPYYLLRVFRAEVGMPPHAYLESVRIRHAQRLIETGRPLAEVAAAVGFSSQSHLTHRFKQIIGTTPGQYAQPLKRGGMS